ncbi:cysteine proteinase [Rozella allomycis CSF55]|uniref:Cysteine proteinase n=1 Tax=Rozella allomycis (strain CSF55) TaxID=988480 RepID=A0A075AXU8_ROZAC|nr:hypothetical protein O9G_003255 [Rozella allomycis CSF55]RKP16870.1 cysteine proteinase [Rozella allomycis CSF55]|eukprot:EPZ33394.1 hypothetical protein O9G_003255 [Rozella allomycis CSF55]
MFEDHDINVLLSKGIENPDSEVFDYYKTNLASLEEEEREKELAYQFYNQSLLESPDLYENSETVINLTDAEILNTPETSSTKQFRNRLDEIQDSFLNERLKDQDIEMEIIESRHPKQQCHMFYFDSLGGSRTCKSIFENLKTYLIAEAKEKYNINANSDYISTFNVRSPIQPNCYDCGVYLLKNIEQFFIQPKETCELILAMKAAGRSHTSRLDASNWFTHGDVSKKRQELYDLFRRKQKEHYSSRLTHMPTVDLSSEDVCIIED